MSTESVDPEGEIDREELHCRRIEIRGYRRADGLYEIEGRLVDTKPYPFRAALADRPVPAGQALHEMGVVLVYDRIMTVRDVRTFTDASPYGICPLAGAALRALIGVSMTRGWNQEVRQRLARADNCTHLVGLLGPMATTAFQSMSVDMPDRAMGTGVNGRPLKLNSCFAYGEGRELVRKAWPDHYTGN
jgi:hypothetical protein